MSKEDMLKADLLSLEPKDFYFKHIVKSHNWYFSDYLHFQPTELVDRMDFFKEIVSKRLGVNFHNIQIVGSAKVGYSLSPYKLFMPFHDERPGKPSSDIDIAIISDRLYQKFWDDLRHIKDNIYNKPYCNRLTKSIFRGYINEKDLQNVNEIREEWTELVRPINVALQDKLGFIHPITYRVYRSWEDLEEYQIIGISSARRLLEERCDV